jgi:hypothetical protein
LHRNPSRDSKAKPTPYVTKNNEEYPNNQSGGGKPNCIGPVAPLDWRICTLGATFSYVNMQSAMYVTIASHSGPWRWAPPHLSRRRVICTALQTPTSQASPQTSQPIQPQKTKNAIPPRLLVERPKGYIAMVEPARPAQNGQPAAGPAYRYNKLES